MALTLSQKWLTICCLKDQSFVYFVSRDFVHISPACGPNTYQIMHGETLDFFAVNLPLKLFRTTVANTESLKSLHTLFHTYLDYVLEKFEPNRIVRNIQKI